MIMIPERHGQTDRRTDGRLTVALPRSALASRGKNWRLATVCIEKEKTWVTALYRVQSLFTNIRFHVVKASNLHEDLTQSIKLLLMYNIVLLPWINKHSTNFRFFCAEVVPQRAKW